MGIALDDVLGADLVSARPRLHASLAMTVFRSAIICVVLAAAACGETPNKEIDSAAAADSLGAHTALASREGYVTVPGGRVWYRVVGNRDATPLLLLHGGPGVPSNYLNPLLALADERPVIIYDQLGAGKSDQPTDTSLWHAERFVRELQVLRDSLGLAELHLYGHSWGTMLAADYLATNPAGVKSVTFASPALSTARWTADADSLKKLLPDSVQRAIASGERRGDFDSPAYQSAVQAYYQKFVTMRPIGLDAESSVTRIAVPIYMQMWGPSEFTSTGNLKTYDATPHLPAIRIPALFTAGEFDEATPATTRYYASLVPGAEFAMISGAAHMTTNDNPAETIRILREWLRKVDAR